MVHYTVLVPARDSTDAVCALVPHLYRVLDGLTLPYEILCIDDASAEGDAHRLQEFVSRHAHLRLLRFEEPRGTSAALTAGIAAARGDLILGACTRSTLEVTIIPHLIARLSQHDLVVAKDRQSWGARMRGFATRSPRVLRTDPQLRGGENLLFATRRQTVAGLSLPRGAFRMLPILLAARGMRVCQLTKAPGGPARGAAVRPGVWSRLAAAWLDRGFEPHRARELAPVDRVLALTLARAQGRPRVVGQPSVVPTQIEHHESS